MSKNQETPTTRLSSIVLSRSRKTIESEKKDLFLALKEEFRNLLLTKKSQDEILPLLSSILNRWKRLHKAKKVSFESLYELISYQEGIKNNPLHFFRQTALDPKRIEVFKLLLSGLKPFLSSDNEAIRKNVNWAFQYCLFAAIHEKNYAAVKELINSGMEIDFFFQIDNNIYTKDLVVGDGNVIKYLEKKASQDIKNMQSLKDRLGVANEEEKKILSEEILLAKSQCKKSIASYLYAKEEVESIENKELLDQLPGDPNPSTETPVAAALKKRGRAKTI